MSDIDVRNQHEVTRHLEARGYTTAMLVPSTAIEQNLDAPSSTFTLEELCSRGEFSPRKIERTFDVSSCRRLCHTEQVYYGEPFETVLARARMVAAGIDQLLSDHQFTYSYQGRGGELFRLLLHHGMEVRDRANVWIGFAPFDDTWVFSTHLDNTWDTYTTVPYSEMTAAEIDETTAFIEGFKSDRDRYTHDPPQRQDGGNGDAGLTDKLPDVRGWFADEGYSYREAAFHNRKERVRKRINETLNRLLLPPIEESLSYCVSNEYVFFPLQYPDESRLTVASPQFYDQQWVIKYLARSIPCGYELVVKQHPNHAGHQSPRWLRRLSGVDNITFLNPHVNAHDVIERADCTVVVNNTVGFECLFYDTPLIVLGDAFYRDVPAVRRVQSLRGVNDAVGAAIEGGVEKEARVASIHSLREAVYDLEHTDDFDAYMQGIAEALVTFAEDEVATHPF